MASVPTPSTDLNETIAAAVKARVEASVLEAFSTDGVLQQYVAAALMQKIERKKDFRTEHVPYMQDVLEKAIQQASRAAVQDLIAEQQETITEEVRKALRRDAPVIAAALVDGFVESSKSEYRTTVDVTIKGVDR